MTLPLAPPTDRAPILAMRQLPASLDPDCGIFLEETTGDVLVRSSVNRGEPDAATKASGVHMHVAGRAGNDGGCGCGCTLNPPGGTG